MASRKNNSDSPIISYLGEPKNENLCIPKAPFEILYKYGSQVKRFRQGKIISPVSETAANTSRCQELSAETLVKIAKTKLLEHNSTDSTLHPSISQSLSFENSKDVDHIFSVLSAAEKFSKQELDSADKLLNKATLFSSVSENPVERVVKYFAEALRQKIDIDRGNIDLERATLFDLKEILLKYHAVILESDQKLPQTQISQFAAIQTILDSVGKSKRIHLIDFSIKTGQHWSIIMQGLSNRKNCHLELLKITAVGKSKHRLEETGKRLCSFAESMNIPFSFKTVVTEMRDLDKDSFDFEGDEALAVYSGMHLWSRLACVDQLRAFLKFIKKLNPRVMVVSEIEASTNTTVFFDRFYGALSLMIATFDCLEGCLKGDVIYWKILEDVFLRGVIQNIVTGEGEERAHRHEKIGFWREIFGEFDIVETGLSDSSLYQASLLVKRNVCWKHSTFGMDGKCLILGWKGTPLQSLSAWKIRDYV